jgi:hypothetical protein
MTIDLDPTLSGRLKAELQHRAARRREALARLHETFPEALGAVPEETPIELGELSAEEVAALTVDVLWPPSQEERQERARRHLADVFGSACRSNFRGVKDKPMSRWGGSKWPRNRFRGYLGDT